MDCLLWILPSPLHDARHNHAWDFTLYLTSTDSELTPMTSRSLVSSMASPADQGLPAIRYEQHTSLSLCPPQRLTSSEVSSLLGLPVFSLQSSIRLTSDSLPWMKDIRPVRTLGETSACLAEEVLADRRDMRDLSNQ